MSKHICSLLFKPYKLLLFTAMSFLRKEFTWSKLAFIVHESGMNLFGKYKIKQKLYYLNMSQVSPN